VQYCTCGSRHTVSNVRLMSHSHQQRIVVMTALGGKPLAAFTDHDAATAWLNEHVAEVELVYVLNESGHLLAPVEPHAFVLRVRSPPRDGDIGPGRLAH
jgi:hypothetical protein